MIELVIFDCDGVLVDTEPKANETLSAYLSELGTAIAPEECHRRFVGLSLTAVSRAYAAMGGAVPPNFIAEIRARTLAALSHGVDPISGVPELLESLTLLRCVASSGSHDKIRQSLRLSGLLGHFDPHIFSADDVCRSKPAPDLFLHAAEQMGAQPSATLVIEDSPAGIQAASAAGMRIVAYMGGPFSDPTDNSRLYDLGAHFIVRDMKSVSAILNDLSPHAR